MMNSKSCMPASRFGIFVWLLFTLALFAPFAGVFGATLQWEANNDPRVAGYKVYVGSQSRQYDRIIDAGLATTQLIQSLEPGHPYYFAVTAYASDGLESALSDEVIYSVPITGTNTTPVPLRVTFSGAASPVTIIFTGAATRRHVVQASVDLLSWQTIALVAPSANGTISWLDTEAPNYPHRFYRVFFTEVTDTVPLNGTAMSVPLGLTFSGGASPVTITFMGEAARPYWVQSSVDLLSWRTIATVTPADHGTIQWLDAEAPNGPMRFYRVMGAQR